MSCTSMCGYVAIPIPPSLIWRWRLRPLLKRSSLKSWDIPTLLPEKMRASAFLRLLNHTRAETRQCECFMFRVGLYKHQLFVAG